jgi:hypothetical protein
LRGDRAGLNTPVTAGCADATDAISNAPGTRQRMRGISRKCYTD